MALRYANHYVFLVQFDQATRLAMGSSPDQPTKHKATTPTTTTPEWIAQPTQSTDKARSNHSKLSNAWRTAHSHPLGCNDAVQRARERERCKAKLHVMALTNKPNQPTQRSVKQPTLPQPRLAHSTPASTGMHQHCAMGTRKLKSVLGHNGEWKRLWPDQKFHHPSFLNQARFCDG